MLSFFPLDVLDETWDLIESVSEGFLTYSYTLTREIITEISFTKDIELNVKRSSSGTGIGGSVH